MSPAYGELQEVGDLLRSAKKKPSKAADLVGARGIFPKAYSMIEAGSVVVVWGAGMAGEGDAASGSGPKGVIAYEKKTPNEGGFALLQDGTVAEMTADQFKSAPKAK